MKQNNKNNDPLYELLRESIQRPSSSLHEQIMQKVMEEKKEKRILIQSEFPLKTISFVLFSIYLLGVFFLYLLSKNTNISDLTKEITNYTLSPWIIVIAGGLYYLLYTQIDRWLQLNQRSK